MPVNDDGLLLKYKQAGWTDEAIAKKFGLTVEEIQKRWAVLLNREKQQSATGYDDLSAQYLILSHQYQLMGESLKALAMGLSAVPTLGEVADCITGDPQETLKRITSSFILLEPYKAVDPIASLEAHLGKTHESN